MFVTEKSTVTDESIRSYSEKSPRKTKEPSKVRTAGKQLRKQTEEQGRQ